MLKNIRREAGERSILCLESGGTKLVAALANRSGELVERRIGMRDAGQTAPETMDQLCRMGEELSVVSTLVAVSLGFGGTVDRAKMSPTICYHEKGWERVNAYRQLSDTFRVPVFIENDCNLAALAEYRFADPKPLQTLLYLTIGTGIGAGVVHDGRLLKLGNLGEAEIGHVVVEPEGPECPCGNSGCLETLCSGPGLENLSRRLAGAAISSKRLMDDLRAGEPLADRICSEGARYMSRALAPAINLFAPDTVIFGGGVMNRNQPYLSKICAETLRSVFPPFRGACEDRFFLSVLREDVVCQGAALYASQELDRLDAG